MIFQEYISIISAVTTIIAVIIGPLVSIAVAKKQSETVIEVNSRQNATARTNAELQAKTTVLAKNRQDWINSLRDEISAFISYLDTALAISTYIKSENKSQLALEAMNEVLLSLYKTKLLINPIEEDHKKIVKLMEDLYGGISKPGFKFDDAKNELVETSQAALKREWERVKQIV